MSATASTFSQSFFHGTKADPKPGDLVTIGYQSNEAVSVAYEGDIQMIDSSSIRVHQHAANAQKKMGDPVAWVARAVA